MNRTSASTGIVPVSRSNITGNLFTSEDEVAKEVANSPRLKYFGGELIIQCIGCAKIRSCKDNSSQTSYSPNLINWKKLGCSPGCTFLMRA